MHGASLNTRFFQKVLMLDLKLIKPPLHDFWKVCFISFVEGIIMSLLGGTWKEFYEIIKVGVKKLINIRCLNRL